MQDKTQTTYDWMTIPTLVNPTYSEKQNNPVSQTDNKDDIVVESTMDVDPFNTTNVTGMSL